MSKTLHWFKCLMLMMEIKWEIHVSIAIIFKLYIEANHRPHCELGGHNVIMFCATLTPNPYKMFLFSCSSSVAYTNK